MGLWGQRACGSFTQRTYSGNLRTAAANSGFSTEGVDMVVVAAAAAAGVVVVAVVVTTADFRACDVTST